MQTIEQNLTQYAAYHRDRRNIATHMVGVPMIVFSLVLALATVWIPIGPVTVTLAAIVAIASCIFYFRLDFIFGVTMAVAYFAMCALASEIVHRMGIPAALGLAALLFVIGWAIQFLGHKYEGMKPAFIDDTKQLLIGPLFICAECYFLAGARGPLRKFIEERVGPTCAKRDGRPIPIFESDA
jgi:uncharacterized membrane protein YGL010W